MVINLPAHSLYGNEPIPIEFPDTWDVQVAAFRGAEEPALTQEQIAEAIREPNHGKPIHEAARGKKDAIIIFDDITRATPIAPIAWAVIAELEKAGIPRDKIQFMAAVGCHRAMCREDFARKLGKDILNEFKVWSHNAFFNCEYVGTTSTGFPIELNAECVHADYKVAMPETIFVKVDKLKELVIKIFEKNGLSAEDSAILADNLLDANARGMHSHGVLRVENYIKRIKNGASDPKAELLLFGFGSYLSIQANVGLAPWEAFQLGIANLIGVKYGNVSVTVGLIILVASLALKEKVGIGTVLNLIFIGKFVDMFNALDLVPQMQRFLPGVGMLLLGLLSVSVGSYFYISGGMGCGPRDALMVALHKRIKGLPVGAIRGIIEGTVLLIGFLLGSKVGLGTVISVFGISFLIQGVFHVFRFDVKSVEHEGFRETWNAIRSREKTQ